MPHEFSDSGEFKTTATFDDVLAAFDDVDDAVVSTGEIAEAIGRGQETARQKLTKLYEENRINRKKVGASIVWWRMPPEDAETRPGRRLRQLSREIKGPIVVEDIVYEDGRTRLLAGAQTEYVEQLSRERDEPIVVGEIVYDDGDIDLLAGVQTETVASEIEEMMRENDEAPPERAIAPEEKGPIFRTVLKRLAAADRLDERAVIDATNADISLDTEGEVDAETLVERIPEENYEAVIREHFDELADQEELTMEDLFAALDEEVSGDA
jgi:DNA-binding Lrp family transcriptional regulator